MVETRALLLTDIVDSTRTAATLGEEAAAALWVRHDRVARDLLAAHGGREIDKSDGFLLLFDSSSAAASYAVAYHQAVGALGLSARAGLHYDRVVLTENDPDDVARGAKPLEVDGLAKPLAARVMAVAIGGQTLATARAVEALGATELGVASHGHWRMKGLEEPIELFEVAEGGAFRGPPPDGAKGYRVVRRDDLWLPVAHIDHSLPRELDAFVGRVEDLVALARRLEEGASLVTVLGTGGTGKTRLAVRLGWTRLGDFPGGVWFCDLSEAREPDGVIAAVASGLGVRLGDGSPVEQLARAIAGRGACLVVLDNLEQVTRHARAVLGPWLDAAPAAQFVVTTREVLGLRGETVLALSPLCTRDAVALLQTRARQGDAAVEDDPQAMEELVELLDGLPLAIELAAARLRIMSPRTLLARMSQRFRVLASTGARQTRQATLRATLDWSWDLLSPPERTGLAQLSVFEGGFTLAAIEAVLDVGDAWPTDVLQGLVDKSLVRRLDDDRFDLLVSVQEYAREHLDDVEAVERRHGWHFALSLEPGPGIGLAPGAERELDNLVAACRRAVGRDEGPLAAAVGQAVAPVLLVRGPYRLLVELLDDVLALSGLAPADRARLQVDRATLTWMMETPDEAEPRAKRALETARASGSSDAEALARCALATVWLLQGRLEDAREELESVQDALGPAQRGLTIRVQQTLCHLYVTLGLPELSARAAAEALVASVELGDRRAEALARMNQAGAENIRGRHAAAVEPLRRALDGFRVEGDHRLAGDVLVQLGHTLNDLGRPRDEVGRQYEEAIEAYRRVGFTAGEGRALAGLGALAFDHGDVDEAGAIVERAWAIARNTRDHQVLAIAPYYLGAVRAAQGRVAEARSAFDAALEEMGVADPLRPEVRAARDALDEDPGARAPR